MGNAKLLHVIPLINNDLLDCHLYVWQKMEHMHGFGRLSYDIEIVNTNIETQVTYFEHKYQSTGCKVWTKNVRRAKSMPWLAGNQQSATTVEQIIAFVTATRPPRRDRTFQDRWYHLFCRSHFFTHHPHHRPPPVFVQYRNEISKKAN